MADETGKKRPGRPAKSGEEKSAVKVWVYLTPREKRELDDYVQFSNLSVSRILRNLLKNAGIVGQVKKDR